MQIPEIPAQRKSDHPLKSYYKQAQEIDARLRFGAIYLHLSDSRAHRLKCFLLF